MTVDMLRKAEGRFWDMVFTAEAEECWEWARGKTGVGYGNFHLSPSESPTGASLAIGAHRVAWTLHHGRMPDPELVLDHLCNNRGCVNPHHLVETTNGWNTARAAGVGFKVRAPKAYAKKDGTTSWRVRFRRYDDDGSITNGSRTFDTEAAALAFIEANASREPASEAFTSAKSTLYIGIPEARISGDTIGRRKMRSPRTLSP